MKSSLVQGKYPVLSLELSRNATSFQSVDEIIEHLKQRIEEHPVARFIAVFDHYSHTKALADGEVSEDILAAKNLVFCFGTKLPEPSMMAVRPRSIGVTETTSGFVVNFLEAPMAPANEAMKAWVESLADLSGRI